MAHIKFAKDTLGFSDALKSKVNSYFATRNKKGDKRLYAKTIVLWSILIVSYYYSMTHWELWSFCIMGICIALCGFNIMHDASHGSYSDNDKLNNTLAFIDADVLGGSWRLWHEKHDIIHHTYTNIEGVDDDIGKHPLFRLAPSHTWKWGHRYQHIYCWFIYLFTTINWFYFSDFVVFWNRKIGNEAFTMKPHEKQIFWIGKSIHFLLFIITPFWLGGITWHTILCLFCMHASASLFLALVFQMAHVVENVHFYPATGEGVDTWYIHEVQTTADFATSSKLWTLLLGGLNFQVEHHLFRDVSHIHYPALRKIVKETCQEYGIVYNSFPTFSAAIASHYRHLKSLGQKPT